MPNVRKNLRKLRLLGREMPKPLFDKIAEDQLNSKQPNLQRKMEWICPDGKKTAIYCNECEDLREFQTIECIENGDLVHRLQCLKCAVIIDEGDI